MKRSFIFIFIFFLFAYCGEAALGQDYKDEKYIDIDVLGWKVKVNTRLITGDTSLLKRSLGLFGKELNDIKQSVPENAVKELQSVTIWFELSSKHNAYTGRYLPLKYVASHKDENPAKGGGIEIIAGQYLEFRTIWGKEWVTMHELAHAYHDRVIGFSNEEIITIYKRILDIGLYREVRKGFDVHHHGYALTNAFEYFAEISTAYFGHNDYYPNDRPDLRHYDDLGYRLVEKMWRVKEK